METKRIVFLVVLYLAVLSGIVTYSLFDKQNEPDSAVRAGGTAAGKPAAPAHAAPDDPVFGRFDCVLAQNDEDIFDLYIKEEGKARRANIVNRNTRQILYASELFPGPENMPGIAVTDFIVSENKMRCLIQNFDLCLVEKQLSDNERGIVDKKKVYAVKWVPFLFNGHLTQAVFIAPDIIRVSNSVGAVMHYRVFERKRIYDEHKRLPGFPALTREEIKAREKIPEPVVRLVWWNGVGEKESVSKNFDLCVSSEKEPVYNPDKGFEKTAHMDKSTRSMMQERVEKNSVAMKIPKEILLKKNGKAISLKTYPYWKGRRYDGSIEYVY